MQFNCSSTEIEDDGMRLTVDPAEDVFQSSGSEHDSDEEDEAANSSFEMDDEIELGQVDHEGVQRNNNSVVLPPVVQPSQPSTSTGGSTSFSISSEEDVLKFVEKSPYLQNIFKKMVGEEIAEGKNASKGKFAENGKKGGKGGPITSKRNNEREKDTQNDKITL